MTPYPGVLLTIAALALAACGGGKSAGSPPVRPAIPSADIAPRDSVAATDAAAPSAAYGDAQLPVAGEVLGTVIHTQDADDLRYVVLQKLTDRYAAEKGFDVTDTEKSAYIAHMRAALSKDPNYTGPLQVARSRPMTRLRAMRSRRPSSGGGRSIALYQQYGGRIIFQQSGPEPLDAYRKFLDESAARGDSGDATENMDAGFWRSYRDDSIHEFFKPGSAGEAKAFADPPWLAD